MPFDASNLHRDEQIVLDLHPHWIMLVKGVVILVVTIALGIWVLTWDLTGTTEQVVKAVAGLAILASLIYMLQRWIAEGANYQEHWTFVAPTRPPVPANGERHPIDAFIGAKLAEKGLKPSAEASKERLLRRLSLDLTGLPPSPEETAAFLADQSPDAYEKQVDRLMASPHYGERWGRHWLDVARYADTKGYVFQEERRYPYAYTYRDWVIAAFNRDLPYDRFLKLQLAADQLTTGEDNRDLAALLQAQQFLCDEGLRQPRITFEDDGQGGAGAGRSDHACRRRRTASGTASPSRGTATGASSSRRTRSGVRSIFCATAAQFRWAPASQSAVVAER